MFFFKNKLNKQADITHSKGIVCNFCTHLGISMRKVVPTPISDDFTKIRPL